MNNGVKAGDSVDLKIGEKTLTIEPVPFGNVKIIFKLVAETIDDMGKETGEAPTMKVPRIMEERVGIILPLLFRRNKYDFLTQEWIDNNLTIIDIRSIIETAIKVNGFDDFLAKLGSRLPMPPPQENDSTVKPMVS